MLQKRTSTRHTMPRPHAAQTAPAPHASRPPQTHNKTFAAGMHCLTYGPKPWCSWPRALDERAPLGHWVYNVNLISPRLFGGFIIVLVDFLLQYLFWTMRGICASQQPAKTAGTFSHASAACLCWRVNVSHRGTVILM